MTKAVLFRPLSAKEWPVVHDRTKAVLCQDTKGIVAWAGERILAGAAFDNWTKTGCQMHIFVDSPLAIRHGFIHEICQYIFVTCGRRMLVGLIPGDNGKSLRFALRAGMRELYRVEDGFDEGVDYVIMRMDRETCRWLNGKERYTGRPRLHRSRRGSGRI